MKSKIWSVVAAILALLVENKSWAIGACTAARFNDWSKTCPLYAGAGAAPAPSSCTECAYGMPRWWVAEPYINLGLVDTPLSYTMSSGQEMDFNFYYKQRARLPEADESPITSLNLQGTGPQYVRGANCGSDAFWGHNWNMSVVIKAIGNPANNNKPYNPAFSGGYYALVFNADGTIDNYTKLPAIQTKDAQSQAIFTDVCGLGYPQVAMQNAFDSTVATNLPAADANGIYWGNTNVGVKLMNPDGSQDIFGLSGNTLTTTIQLQPSTNYVARLLLTKRIDAQGRVTQLGYEYYHDPASIYWMYRLKYVVDPDFRTNKFLYTASTNAQLAEIDDPYGRKTTLAYTGNDNSLKQIVDAVGMTNSFQYASSVTFEWDSGSSSNVSFGGWLSQLTTRYGTNKFRYYEKDDSTVIDGVQQRGLFVSEPEQAGQLYYYRHQSGSGLVPDTDTAPSVTGITNFDDGTAGGVSLHKALSYRNTFHWGRRQFANTTSYVQTYLAAAAISSSPSLIDGDFAAAFSYLNANDYAKADMKHWLWQSDNISISSSLSSERAPSFDAAGTTAGVRTWYDYTGKPDNGAEDIGSNPQIACVARILPDGSSQYSTYNFYPTYSAGAGLVSDNEATFTKPDGAQGLLTNWFTYSGNNVDLLNVSNSAGQYVQYLYNGGHQVTNIVNALGQVTILNWDSFANLTGIQFPSGESITLNRNYFSAPDPNALFPGNIVFSPSGRCLTNTYFAGLPVSITDDRGVTVTNTWDNLNRLTSTVFPDGTSVSNVYSRLDLVASKDRMTNWTLYAYDGLQHLTNAVNANGATNSYVYCGCGSLNSIRDALGNFTYLNYDNQGNLTNIGFPDTSSLTWQYDLAGRVTSLIDGVGRALRLAYNIEGLVTNTANANGSLQTVTFDALGRPTIITDANGVTITNAFDAINELVQRTWAGGISEGYGYSPAGLIAYTNRDGKATFYTRDGAGRETAEMNPNQEVTRLAYDSLDHVTDLWDGNTNHTQLKYNEYGWLTNKVDGLGRSAFSYLRNANGWVTSRATPEKGTTSYTYDGVGNLKSINYPLSTINYSYDALNQLTNLVDALGNHSFTRTARGQLASESDSWTTNSWTYVQGLRTVMSIASWSQTYRYDSGWRMTNTASTAGAFNYSYNFHGASALVTGISLPNGANIVNTFDALARLTGTSLNNYWGHKLDGYSYTIDPLGLRTNILRNFGLTTNSVSVGFDNIGQLTSWSAVETGGTPRQNEQLGFSFDPAHNLHSRNNGNLAQTFITDAANQLTGITHTGTFTLTGATPAPATNITVSGQPAQINGDFTFARTNLSLNPGNNTFTNVAVNKYGLIVTNTLTVNFPSGVTLAYDLNGNLTNDGLKTFAYDSENQLTNIFVPGQWRSDFAYDGLSRRRIERDYSWTGSTWAKTNEIHFIYDGLTLVQERDASNNVLVTYSRGLDLSGSLNGAGGIGGLLARTDANGSTYYHTDGAGNVTALMDGGQNIVARYLYGPFGKMVGQWGSMASVNEMQFSSMPHHNLSGLTLYAYRAYDPNLQRWPNQDPIQEAGGLNLYRFVNNDPIYYVDPTGKAPQLTSLSFDPSTGQSSAQYQPFQFGQGYGIYHPDYDPVADLYQHYDALLDRILPPINPNTDPYAYYAEQAARELAFAAALAALTDRLSPPEVKCPGKGGPCFAAGTKVSTPDGEVNIEDIKVGDTVYAYDFDGGKGVERRVAGTPRNETYYWVYIQIGDETIKATRTHPFWVENENQWVEAVDLEKGMLVRLENGKVKVISSVVLQELQAPETTYNLVVDGEHNYFAGTSQVLVHNGTPLDAPGYWNYHLVDAEGNVYYHGMAGPDQSVADVESRHANTVNRFDPDSGDRLVPEPGVRSYGDARRMEYEHAVRDGTVLPDRNGVNAGNYRGNRQRPIGPRNLDKYYGEKC